MPQVDTRTLKDGLSVVIIGKDEAHMLPKTLPSLSNFANEVIFVDTGSTDNTVEIAKEHGCLVVFFPWNDDFSSAKNFGIEHACYQWILNLDCDEEVDLSNHPRVLFDAIKHRGDMPGLITSIRNVKPEGDFIVTEAMRLFRNDPKIRFQGRIHESVAESVITHWPNYITQKCEIRIIHYGYLNNRDQKFDRNIRLLGKWLADEPDNIYAAYKLGSNLYHLGKKTEGMEILSYVAILLQNHPARRTFAFLDAYIESYHQILLENNRQTEADEFLKLTSQW